MVDPLEISLQPLEEGSEGLGAAKLSLSPLWRDRFLPGPVLGQREKCCQARVGQPAGFPEQHRPTQGLSQKEDPPRRGAGRGHMPAMGARCFLGTPLSPGHLF